MVVPAVVGHAAANPAAPALSWRGTTMTYAELVEAMRSMSARLDELAPGPIGVHADKSPGAVALILACLAVGRRFLLPIVPIPMRAVDRATNGRAMFDLLTDGRPHVVQAVPMLYEPLLDARKSGQALDFVDHLIITGDALRPARLAGLCALFPGAGHRLHAVPRVAIPSTLRVTDEPLPRTATGKVDRKQITAKVE